LACTYTCQCQREISNAADTAARLYREATHEDRRLAPEIWDTMTKAKEKLIKNIRSKNFEKYISVAHKDNGEEFFDEVQSLPTLNFICYYLCIVFVEI
jgi:vacuolar-type H+-ATPase subunit H